MRMVLFFVFLVGAGASVYSLSRSEIDELPPMVKPNESIRQPSATVARPTTGVAFVDPQMHFPNVKGTFSHTFHFENRTAGTITVRDVKPSCSCAITKPTKKTYPPGSSGEIPVSIDLRRKPRGLERFHLTLDYTDEAGLSKQTLTEFPVENKPDLVISPNPIVLDLIQGQERTPKSCRSNNSTDRANGSTSGEHFDSQELCLRWRRWFFLPGFQEAKSPGLRDVSPPIFVDNDSMRAYG